MTSFSMTTRYYSHVTMHTMAAAVYSHSYHWDVIVVANFRHWLSGNGAPTPNDDHILERMFPPHLPKECVE